MTFTQAELERAGYEIPAAAEGDWQCYDERQPVPGYFQFDWLSARHPDLYHRFAISTVGFMNELARLVDLSEMDVVDIGAGTGRTTLEAAKQARKVTAIDIFPSVLAYGKEKARQAGLTNVWHLRADCARLPLPDNCLDACICAWAVISHPEAYRVLKPGGFRIIMVAAPGALCGELTATLADAYPDLITEVGPESLYDPDCPPQDSLLHETSWNGVPVTGPVWVHDFTHVADYQDPQEAAAILGRLYGPRARQYMLDRRQSTLAWRLRIEISRVSKA